MTHGTFLLATFAVTAGAQDVHESCASQVEDTEELSALQTVRRYQTLSSICSVGDHVECPGSGNKCAGNQCCPRTEASGNKTFPCPSADPTEDSNCESDDKVADCLVQPCCRGNTAECLACAADQSVEVYCESNPDTVGCELHFTCCRGQTAECLACAEGVSEEEYCADHPEVVGCRPQHQPQPRLLQVSKKEAYDICTTEGYAAWKKEYDDMTKACGGGEKGIKCICEDMPTTNDAMKALDECPADSPVKKDNPEIALANYSAIIASGKADCAGVWACSAGDHVECPGSGTMCAGNQCCPPTEASGNKTFPCPSADPTEDSNCESDDKVADCLLPPSCCWGNTAECLACVAGLSVEVYCKYSVDPYTLGCPGNV